MKIVFITRCMNDNLIKKCQSLINNIECSWIIIKNSSQESYQNTFIDIDADVLVNIDEDAFVCDEQTLLDHIMFIYTSKYDYSGFPDGGSLDIRPCLPCAMNPFFNVFKWNSIKAKLGLTKTNFVNKYNSYTSELVEKINSQDSFLIEKFAPVTPIRYGYHEGFYSFFYMLYKELNPYFITATYLDKPNQFYTTVLYHNDKPFLYHTWYSRTYDYDQANRNRIDAAFRYAKEYINHE